MRIAIIGGGASGTLLAAQLARVLPAQGADIVVVEPAEGLGLGVAYGTRDPAHLLNVPAGNMSAFADNPGHLLDWLASSGIAGEVGAGTFLCRQSYGAYLGAIAKEMLAGPAVRQVRDRCVDLSAGPGTVTVSLASGGTLEVDQVVLATGNDAKPPTPGQPSVYAWAPGVLDGLEEEAPVMVLGSGLTMVDLVLSLDARGHRGPIVVVSRRGLLPLSHAPAPRVPLDAAAVPFDAPMSARLAWLRRHAAAMTAEGGNWRTAIEPLRPHTRALWRAFSPAERRRFLAHARPYWDIHRHRMPPAVHARIAALRADGRLRVIAGRVLDAERDDKGVTVRLGIAGAAVPEIHRAARLIDATGLADDPRRTTNELIAALLDRGVARIDPTGIGLDVAGDSALIGADGKPAARISAVGPVCRAAFWEITSVPDIRVQCSDLALALAGGTAGAA